MLTRSLSHLLPPRTHRPPCWFVRFASHSFTIRILYECMFILVSCAFVSHSLGFDGQNSCHSSIHFSQYRHINPMHTAIRSHTHTICHSVALSTRPQIFNSFKSLSAWRACTKNVFLVQFFSIKFSIYFFSREFFSLFFSSALVLQIFFF